MKITLRRVLVKARLPAKTANLTQPPQSTQLTQPTQSTRLTDRVWRHPMRQVGCRSVLALLRAVLGVVCYENIENTFLRELNDIYQMNCHGLSLNKIDLVIEMSEFLFGRRRRIFFGSGPNLECQFYLNAPISCHVISNSLEPMLRTFLHVMNLYKTSRK